MCTPILPPLSEREGGGGVWKKNKQTEKKESKAINKWAKKKLGGNMKDILYLLVYRKNTN